MDKDYWLLRTQGNAGFYDHCQATTIYLHTKKDKKNYNFFTIISFSEGQHNENIEYLTPNLIEVAKGVSLGIVTYSMAAL